MMSAVARKVRFENEAALLFPSSLVGEGVFDSRVKRLEVTPEFFGQSFSCVLPRIPFWREAKAARKPLEGR
jgi:hypothetical protein